MSRYGLVSNQALDKLKLFLSARTAEEAEACNTGILMPGHENQAAIYAMTLELTPLIISYADAQAPKDKKEKFDADSPKVLFFFRCLWLISGLSLLAVLHDDFALAHFLHHVISGRKQRHEKIKAKEDLIQQLRVTIKIVEKTKDFFSSLCIVSPSNIRQMNDLLSRMQGNLERLIALNLNLNSHQISLLREGFILDDPAVLKAKELLDQKNSDEYKNFKNDLLRVKESKESLEKSASATPDEIKKYLHELASVQGENLNLSDEEEEIQVEIKELGTLPPSLSPLLDEVDEPLKNDLINSWETNINQTDEMVKKLQTHLEEFRLHSKNKKDFLCLLSRDAEVLEDIAQWVYQERSQRLELTKILISLKTAMHERSQKIAVNHKLRKYIQKARKASFEKDASRLPHLESPENEREEGEEKEQGDESQVREDMARYYRIWHFNLHKFNNSKDVFYSFYWMNYALNKVNCLANNNPRIRS